MSKIEFLTSWLIAALAVNCGLFALLDRRLSRGRAAMFMAIAMVVCALPTGLFALLVEYSFIGVILALPLIWVLSSMVNRRLDRLPPFTSCPAVLGSAAMRLFTVCLLASLFLHAWANGVLLNHHHAAYWVLKWVIEMLDFGAILILSTVLQEGVIASLAGEFEGEPSFHVSVFRANAITLGVGLLMAAVQSLPERLQAPHFIPSLSNDLLMGILGLS